MGGKESGGNGWQKIPLHFGGIFDFVDTTLLYGMIFDLHRNGIYAIISEGKKNNNE